LSFINQPELRSRLIGLPYQNIDPFDHLLVAQQLIEDYCWFVLMRFLIFTVSQESGVSLHRVEVFTMVTECSEFLANS
jgi:hypothetical protein